MEYMLPGEPDGVPAAPPDVVTSGSDLGAERRTRRFRLAGLVAAGVVAAVVGIGVAQASGTSGGTPRAATGPAGGSQNGLGPGGLGTPDDAAAPDGTGAPPPGFAGGPPAGGGVDGEQRIVGTLASSTAASVTVKSQDGTTATYAVDASTDVRKDGQAASLSSLTAGEQVLVHVIPSDGGKSYAERVLAGTFGRGGRGVAPPPGATTGGGGTGGTTGSTTSTT